MKIPGTWAKIVKVVNGKKIVDTIANAFHDQTKNRLREMLVEDPDATGSKLLFFLDLTFDKRLAATTEPDEKPVPNEQFIIKLVEDYNRRFSLYKPGFIERRIKDRAIEFFVALYRVDSAYFERLGGMITYLIAQHQHKFTDLNGNYLTELKDLHDWWNENDYRDRSRPWIEWGFKFILNKYQTDDFYKKSINHVLLFIHNNHKNWIVDYRYNPDIWYPFGRGIECNMLHGGNY
jgi:hypothetical protein